MLPFYTLILDKELTNLSDKLKQVQALSEQKGVLNNETINCELEIHCCMTFNTLDKELATLDEKFKQQQVLTEQKGTSKLMTKLTLSLVNLLLYTNI